MYFKDKRMKPVLDAYKHYMVDGQPMSMKEMREIVADVLGHGPVAYHYPVHDILRILQKDNRKVVSL
jgi:hypothetical protein